MTASEFRETYWKYYLTLEKDVSNIEPYVAFHPDNYHCYSNEFMKLFQVICSEIDVVCKQYCSYIKSKIKITGDIKNIKDYAKFILSKHPEIVTQVVSISGHGDCKLVPWKEWSCNFVDHKNSNNQKNVTPKWWDKYNAVKHNRSDMNTDGIPIYTYSNLENVLLSLSALYVIEKFFYFDLAIDDTPTAKVPNISLHPHSRLFDLFDLDNRYAYMNY